MLILGIKQRLQSEYETENASNEPFQETYEPGGHFEI